jgi:hypothetical protein
MNYPQQSAQGLASLGRYGDSMLVHMSPKEVAGLQSLAMSKGGSLTINPDTGLPEAFILDLALPVAGAFFGIPPEFTAALMAGKTLIEGGDIGSAALSAFGGYTGGKFGQNLKSFVDPIKNVPTSAINAAANTAKTAGSFAGSTGEMGSKLLSPSGGASQIGSNLGSVANEFGTNIPVEDAFKKSFSPDFGKSNFAPGFADNNIQGSFMGKDVGAQGMFQPGGGNTLQTTGAPTYGANVGAGTDIASTISEGASDFGNQFGAAVKNPIDFARHVGEGDALMGGAKLGMYAASPFVKDMMKPPQFSFSDPDIGKYRGPQGQLNLSDQFDTGLRLAQGGTVTTGGLRDLYGTSDLSSNPQLSQDGYGIGRLNTLASQESLENAKSLGYAEGGETSMNLDELPTLNVETGKQSYNTIQSALANSDNPQGKLLNRMFSFRPGGRPSIYDQFTAQGLGRLNNSQMAKGGYLDGQGDGMSDSIPATIEGKQPARLADGEFVVPADVVSHLGNGSSKAGSKRLYKMLDKVRHARTGNKKQGKQIKADKYLPA